MANRLSNNDDEWITLSDSDDELNAICDAFIKKNNTSAVKPPLPTESSSFTTKWNGITVDLNAQISEYRTKEQNKFIQPPSTSGVRPKSKISKSTTEIEVINLDDDDDEDILKAIELSLANSSGRGPKEVPETGRQQTWTPKTSGHRDPNMSEADWKAITEALEDLESNYNNSQPIDEATRQLIEILYTEDDDATTASLESYNENAATIRALPIVHPDLEYLDPNPDIIELYRQFDVAYFEGFLTQKALKVGWANNFYSVAGTFFSNKDGAPTILLSANLLTLRPRRDLVETLLHEMIHAFIYFKRLKDTNDHGNIFQQHMARINATAGTNITIYHSFHDEVSYLRQYIWRCTGPKCQAVQPYRGYISLPTKRRPSRWDKAFRVHEQLGCEGCFKQVSNNFDEEHPRKKKRPATSIPKATTSNNKKARI